MIILPPWPVGTCPRCTSPEGTRPPSIRIVSQRIFSEPVAPDHQNEKKGNPPGRRDPTEEGKPFQKRKDLLQERPLGRNQNESGPCQSRDGNGFHVDPVKGIQFFGGEGKESETVEDQGDDESNSIPHPEFRLHKIYVGASSKPFPTRLMALRNYAFIPPSIPSFNFCTWASLHPP